MDTNVLDFSYRGENVMGKEKTLIMSSFFFFLHDVFITFHRVAKIIAWLTELSFEDNSSLNPFTSILYSAVNEV